MPFTRQERLFKNNEPIGGGAAAPTAPFESATYFELSSAGSIRARDLSYIQRVQTLAENK